MNKSERVVRAAAIVTVAYMCVGASCTTNPLRAAPIADPLGKAGWTYVDVPRQILGPGSIVSIRDSDGIRYRGHIRDCVPPAAIEVVGPKPIGLAGIIGKSYDISVGALLGYHDIKIGANLSDVRSVTVKIGQGDEEAVNEIKLVSWISDNFNNMSSTCIGYFRGHSPVEEQKLANNIFVLMDVLRVTGYSYQFNDKNGLKIDLKPPGVLAKYVTFEAGIDAKVSANGDLNVNEPLYIAFKRGTFIRPGVPLGAAPQDVARDVMQRRFLILNR